MAGRFAETEGGCQPPPQPDNGGMPHHVSVLPVEVLELLAPQPGQIIVDCTLGAGGHTRQLAEKVGPNGRVIGIDCDPTMIELARPRLAELPVQFVNAGFEELRQVLNELDIDRVDSVLADLGFCSDQVEDPARGFRFQVSGPLDMRLDPNRGQPAARLLATLPERELADLIYQYGEERHSRRIARKIVERRAVEPLTTTEELADLVRSCVPRGHGKIDPATRTFQALRIAVNDEIAALEALLKQLPYCIKPGGRAALISFHSLEDRLVKQTFRQSEVWEPLTKKPITPSDEEVRNNPRSRSAKLRVAKLKMQGGDT